MVKEGSREGLRTGFRMSGRNGVGGDTVMIMVYIWVSAKSLEVVVVFSRDERIY